MSEKAGKRVAGEQKTDNLQPPDGGWGWVIMCAGTINVMFGWPVIQNFGLIYKGRLDDLNLSSVDVTTIISTYLSIGSILGIFQGPLLKRFGFRKMAFFGVSMFFAGTFLTGIANSFALFMLFTGIISSIGFIYADTSFSMAMNLYFKKGKNRSRAFGFLMGCAGLGPVLIPLFVTHSLESYGVTATAFLLAALTGHGFVAASLLRPVKWYLKKEPIKDADLERRDNSNSVDDCEGNMENHQPFSPENTRRADLSISGTNGLEQIAVELQKKNEPLQNTPIQIIEDARSNESVRKKGCWINCWSYFKDQFDVDMLHDSKFITVALGMSIAMTGEMLFSLLLPFLLNEIGLDIPTTAYFMSTYAFADIVSRFIAPYMGEWISSNSQVMYSIAQFLLIIVRACLLLPVDTIGLFAIAVAIGLAKGLRTVYLVQIIPDNVPREKLGSCVAFHELMIGILVFLSGPLSGAIVEVTSSYLSIIYVSNAFTATTLLFWGGQWIILKTKKRDHPSVQ